MRNMIGRRIGKYKVMAELGAGGMATVYKAVQDSLDRLVAIKELKRDFNNDDSLVERFEREARSIAYLTHQNIVHMYDYLEYQGNKYMVMEFVEGVDLSELLPRVERLPADIAAIVGLQVAQALEYAHYRGIVHRDIKPSNVMISKQGEVKLMDFGIARHEEMGDLTLPGTALGTPSYMSPEQIMAQKVDFKSDIFSFGILLYQMLTGAKPFVEDEKNSVMQKILIGRYLHPRNIFGDIPRPLVKIIKRCLRNDPNKRYKSTELLRQDLERYVSRTVKINYSGRIVIFMRNRDLISDSDAETYVKPELLEDLLVAAKDRGENRPKKPYKLKLTFATSLILIIGVGILIISMQFGLFPAKHISKVFPEKVLAIPVSTKPWSEIYISYSPFAALDTREGSSLYLLPGKYDIEIENPNCESSKMTLEVDPERKTRIRRYLRSCKNTK